jgi:hypothetical protein
MQGSFNLKTKNMQSMMKERDKTAKDTKVEEA